MLMNKEITVGDYTAKLEECIDDVALFTNGQALDQILQKVAEDGETFDRLNIDYDPSTEPTLDLSSLSKVQHSYKLDLRTSSKYNIHVTWHDDHLPLNIEDFFCVGGKNAFEVASYLSNLKVLTIVFDKKSVLHDLNNFPHLKVLQMQAVKGSLSDLGASKTLEELYCIGLSTDTLEPLIAHKKLRTLKISGLRPRSIINVQFLEKMKNLEMVELVTSKILDGWDVLVLPPKVHTVRVGILPSMKFIENNPHVDSICVKQVGELKGKELKALGWVKRGSFGYERRNEGTPE